MSWARVLGRSSFCRLYRGGRLRRSVSAVSSQTFGLAVLEGDVDLGPGLARLGLAQPQTVHSTDGTVGPTN